MINIPKKRKTKKSIKEVENGLIELFTRIYSKSGEYIIKKYGKESIKILKEAFITAMVEMWLEQYKNIKNRGLKTYIKWLLSIVSEGTEYEVIESTDTSVRLKFTRCPWALYFRSIGNPQLGKFFCDADFSMVKEFNEDIKLKRDKTLMDGDSFCNHHFFIKK